MSSVIVCDGCSNILHLYEDHYVVESYSKGPATKVGLHVDLCPKCYKEFENYFKHIKSSK